jgi:ABC-2 type transport system permease protein
MNKLLAMIRLELQRILRNRQFLIFSLIFPVGFYMLYTRLYPASGRYEGTNWAAYYMISMSAFGAIAMMLNTTGTRVAIEREAGWPLYLVASPLTALGYVSAKIVVALVTTLLGIAIVFLVAVGFNHVTLPLHTWITVGAELWLGSIPFAAIGLFLAYALGPSSVGLGVTIVYLAGSFLGGLWIPLRVLPSTLRAIAHTLPTYHDAALAWTTLQGGKFSWVHPLVLAGYTVGFGALAAWLFVRQQGFGHD